MARQWGPHDWIGMGVAPRTIPQGTASLGVQIDRHFKLEELLLDATHPFIHVSALSVAGLPLNLGSRGIPFNLFAQQSKAAGGWGHGRHSCQPGQMIRVAFENMSPWDTDLTGVLGGFPLSQGLMGATAPNKIGPVSRVYDGLGSAILSPGDSCVLTDTFNRTVLVDHVFVSAHLWHQPRPGEGREQFSPSEEALDSVRVHVSSPGLTGVISNVHHSGSMITPECPPTGRGGLALVGERIEVKIHNKSSETLFLAGCVIGEEPSPFLHTWNVEEESTQAALAELAALGSEGPISRRVYMNKLLALNGMPYIPAST